jgi:hypothetical protein
VTRGRSTLYTQKMLNEKLVMGSFSKWLTNHSEATESDIESDWIDLNSLPKPSKVSLNKDNCKVS